MPMISFSTLPHCII